jgi:hypothetical protein
LNSVLNYVKAVSLSHNMHVHFIQTSTLLVVYPVLFRCFRFAKKFEVLDETLFRTVDNFEEACKLLRVGFEYVCDLDGKKLFRKRK